MYYGGVFMFYKVLSFKRVASAVIIIFLFAMSAGFAARMLTAAVNGTIRLLPIYCVKTDKKKVAITFDAAWENTDTKELIEILDRYGARATFFIVGDWAKKYPDDVKALFNAGHQIANHSNTHAAFSSLSSDEVESEITLCNEKLAAITGLTPKYVRFPSGDYDNESIRAAEEMGLYVIQWSVDSLDYKGLTPERIKQRVLKSTKEGSIILFHTGVANTPAALETILSNLKGQGFSFVCVEELIYKNNYKIDHTGQQIQTSIDDN